MSVRLSDIAKLVNIDKGSVSRVLRSDVRANELRPETRHRILEAARKLGYRRDDMAAAMTLGKGNVSGFLVQYGYNEYTARILNGMLSEAGKFDHLIKLISVNPSTKMEEIADFCVRQRMTALTTYNSLSDSEGLRRMLLKHQILLVQIGSDRHFPEVNTFSLDHYAGGRLAFEHLYSLGHRRFVLFGYLESADWAELRNKGFCDAAREAGIKIPPRCKLLSMCPAYDDSQEELSQTNLKKLFVGRFRSTAVFAFNDMLGINMISRLQHLGLSIPGDVSVMGFGAAEAGLAVYPKLTTVNDPVEKMGVCAVRLILENKERKSDVESGLHQYFQPELMVRNSTAVPKS